jgi:hypothetical protein
MDHVRHTLVGCPLLCGKASRGVRVAGTQVGPPPVFQPFLERLGVERAEDIATHALSVLGYESQGRLEQPVRGGKNVPEQLGVMEERGCIPAVIACQEADPVQSLEVSGTVRADAGSGALHGPLLPADLGQDARCAGSRRSGLRGNAHVHSRINPQPP